MTQDKDREELLSILEGKIMRVDNISEDGEKFIKKLLRWKRGEKWWCEHLRSDENNISGWQFSSYGFNCFYVLGSDNTHRWKFCPMCAVKRPGE